VRRARYFDDLDRPPDGLAVDQQHDLCRSGPDRRRLIEEKPLTPDLGELKTLPVDREMQLYPGRVAVS